MSRTALSAAALTLALAACGPQPPRGMKRLDSGAMNHSFRVDHSLRSLYYIAGGGDFQTSLVIADLDTGKSRSYRFSGRQIETLSPSAGEGVVNLGARITHYDDEFRRGEQRYALMKVGIADGRVREEEERDGYDDKDVVFFRDKKGRGAPDALLPATSVSGIAMTAAALASTAAAAGLEDGEQVVSASVVEAPVAGVRTARDRKTGRVARFFATAAKPVDVVSTGGDKLYTEYRGKDGLMAVEELDMDTGARRVLARFKGDVQSMAVSGMGLLLLRREGEGPRTLTLLDAASGSAVLDVPWSDGDSRLLGVDPARRLLYVAMKEGRHDTAWAVPLDTGTLRAASAYLAAARAPKKATRGMVVGGWLCVIAFLVLLGSAVIGGRR